MDATEFLEVSKFTDKIKGTLFGKKQTFLQKKNIIYIYGISHAFLMESTEKSLFYLKYKYYISLLNLCIDVFLIKR